MLKSRLLLCGVLLACVSSVAQGENWPGWRGPRGDGTSLESNVPVQWNGPAGENIAWKSPLPGIGHSSPVVWGDHIFLISCIEETQERVLLCLDRRDGDTLWQRTIFTAPLETKHARNSYASGTPATDGELVYVALLQVDGSTIPAPNVSNNRDVTPGKIIIAAYDFDGNPKWTTSAGEFISAHGFCSCPVLYQDLLIINGDHDGQSYIAAMKKATGEMVWKIPRQHQTRSYVTPIIRELGGRTQMVLSGSKHVASYDPRTGSQIWMINGPTEQYVASMVDDGERLFMAAGFPTYHVMAIRPDGVGDVTETHVAWHSTDAKCYVPSPVVVGKYLLVADDRGTGNCFDAVTGERLWQARLGRAYGSSLVTAGGLVYFLADDGMTKVIEPGKELKVIAESPLGEFCNSSPAISQGQIFIRAEHHLWAIGK